MHEYMRRRRRNESTRKREQMEGDGLALPTDNLAVLAQVRRARFIFVLKALRPAESGGTYQGEPDAGATSPRASASRWRATGWPCRRTTSPSCSGAVPVWKYEHRTLTYMEGFQESLQQDFSRAAESVRKREQLEENKMCMATNSLTV